jgi:hypothetical protein
VQHEDGPQRTAALRWRSAGHTWRATTTPHARKLNAMLIPKIARSGMALVS